MEDYNLYSHFTTLEFFVFLSNFPSVHFNLRAYLPVGRVLVCYRNANLEGFFISSKPVLRLVHRSFSVGGRFIEGGSFSLSECKNLPVSCRSKRRLKVYSPQTQFHNFLQLFLRLQGLLFHYL